MRHTESRWRAEREDGLGSGELKIEIDMRSEGNSFQIFRIRVRQRYGAGQAPLAPFAGHRSRIEGPVDRKASNRNAGGSDTIEQKVQVTRRGGGERVGVDPAEKTEAASGAGLCKRNRSNGAPPQFRWWLRLALPTKMHRPGPESGRSKSPRCFAYQGDAWLAEPVTSSTITVTLKGEPEIVGGVPVMTPVVPSITRLRASPMRSMFSFRLPSHRERHRVADVQRGGRQRYLW